MQKTAIIWLLLIVAVSSAWGITQHPTYPTTGVSETVSYYTCIQNKGVGAKDLTVTVSFNTEIATTEKTSYLILPGDEEVVMIQITPQEEGNKIIQARYTGRTEGNIEISYLVNIPLTVTSIGSPSPDPCAGVTCPSYCSNGILYKDGMCYEGVCVYSTTECPSSSGSGGSGSSIYYPPPEQDNIGDNTSNVEDTTSPPGGIIGEQEEIVINNTIDNTTDQIEGGDTVIIGDDTVIREDETIKDTLNPLTLMVLALFAIILSIGVLCVSSDGREYVFVHLHNIKEKIEEKIEEVRG